MDPFASDLTALCPLRKKLTGNRPCRTGYHWPFRPKAPPNGVLAFRLGLNESCCYSGRFPARTKAVQLRQRHRGLVIRVTSCLWLLRSIGWFRAVDETAPIIVPIKRSIWPPKWGATRRRKVSSILHSVQDASKDVGIESRFPLSIRIGWVSRAGHGRHGSKFSHDKSAFLGPLPL